MPHKQCILELEVLEGCTARQAAVLSAMDQEFENLDLQKVPLGIFGVKAPDDYALKAGDRVELYRPLQIDPMEARRARAKKD